jgi:hypothetical protein
MVVNRRMRTGIAAITLLLLAVTWVFAAAEENKPALVIEEIVHDFGMVFEAQNYKHTFIVTNEGKADLIIKSVKPG